MDVANLTLELIVKHQKANQHMQATQTIDFSAFSMKNRLIGIVGIEKQ